MIKLMACEKLSPSAGALTLFINEPMYTFLSTPGKPAAMVATKKSLKESQIASANVLLIDRLAVALKHDMAGAPPGTEANCYVPV